MGPVLVVAEPGAGKTYCLISRIQHLIASGIDPHRICAVTFTNRAAEEIAERLKHTLGDGDGADAVTRGTIHALCLALLREHTDAAGLRQGFGVADEDYQRVILSRLRVPADRRGQLLTLFGRHRFQGYRLTSSDQRLLHEYQSWLAHRNMVDFDQLIIKAEPLADRVADRWDHVLVDEFQDVNAVQYDLLKKLVEPHGSFFAVGDDEQSIFTWTGADPYVLVRFQRDYDVEPIILEKNCRCSRQIFETARRVLAQNPQLFHKQLSADRESPYEVEAHAFRNLARRRPGQDPDTKKLWRLVYQVENLRALPRSHGTLQAVVDELLSQSIGPYRNALEERHDELTDPADVPEAVALAEKLQQASEISFAPRGGVEVALRGMLAAAGFRKLPSTPASTIIDADALTVFKALQLLHASDLGARLERYVTFDFETTDMDVATCGVVDIGAARVVNGEIVERFQSLVNPYRPISRRATEVHGYTDADVKDAPPFHAVFTQFHAFVGKDILVAHNGQKFDIPVLRRLAANAGGVDDLVFYDTLPLVRSLSQDSGKLADIAARCGIDVGRGHHALDDACTLALVYRELEAQRIVRARKAVLNNLLDYVGLAFAIEHGARNQEQELLFNIGRFHALGAYTDTLEFYAMERERSRVTAPEVEEVIRRLGGRSLMARLRAETEPAQRYPAAVARLGALMVDAGSLDASIDLLLERVALPTSEGVELAPDRVNLLTLHSTKGLEFSRVYILGVEDYEIPGYQAVTNNITAEIEEARRLLYVGMTRARERLVLTRVPRRFGRETGGSSSLEEMRLRTLDLRDPKLRPALLG